MEFQGGGGVDKKISTREYNNKAVYDCFNSTFSADCGSRYFNLPPIYIDDRSCLYKTARYTPDMISDDISISYENFVSCFTIPSDSKQPLLLTSGDHNPFRAMKKYKPYRVLKRPRSVRYLWLTS